MKQAFLGLVGNDRLKTRLHDDILSGHLSHAYILEGAPGTGKRTLAKELAAALSCEKKQEDGTPLPCMSCPSCRKILSGNSPDLISVRREADKATLGIGIIRQMRNDVYLAPNDGEVKVYVIEDAHLMTPEAQNALLLTLEEPPSYVLFLLLCEKSESLLETVRSRAPILRTQPLSRRDILAYLVKHAPEAEKLYRESPADLSELIAAGGDSIGGALSLLPAAQRKAVLERRHLTRTLLSAAASGRGQAALLSALTKLSKKGKREGAARQMKELSLALRDLIAVKLCENAPLCFFADAEEASALSDTFTTQALFRLRTAAERANEKLQMNANVHLTLYAFASDAGLI